MNNSKLELCLFICSTFDMDVMYVTLADPNLRHRLEALECDFTLNGPREPSEMKYDYVHLLQYSSGHSEFTAPCSPLKVSCTSPS